jgi:hypothetical protein
VVLAVALMLPVALGGHSLIEFLGSRGLTEFVVLAGSGCVAIAVYVAALRLVVMRRSGAKT